MKPLLFFFIGLAVGGVAVYLLSRRTPEGATRSWRSSFAADRVREVAEERRAYLESVFEGLSEGVMVFDDTFRPVLINAAARSLLLGSSSASNNPPPEVLSIARQALVTDAAADEVVDVWLPDRRSLQVRAVSLSSHDGVVVTLRDVSAEREAQRLRRQFVSHASHELKTPVASIQTLGEAISQAVADDPEAATRFARRLLSETDRLGRLVADLLDLSRLEDPASFKDALADLSDLAEQEFNAFAPLASSKALEYSGEIQPGLVVRGDEGQLALLIRNLLDNAIRYSPSGASVRLVLEAVDGMARVLIADTGPGIPMKARHRVFERFFRVDDARDREHGGTGLGLAIVKHVAELHGGRVEVDSEFGEGSTFSAVLPLASDGSVGPAQLVTGDAS